MSKRRPTSIRLDDVEVPAVDAESPFVARAPLSSESGNDSTGRRTSLSGSRTPQGVALSTHTLPPTAKPHHERGASTISWEVLSHDESGPFFMSHSGTTPGGTGAHRTPRSRRSSIMGRRKEEIIPPKPYQTQLQQQKLRSFAPLLSPKYVLSCFLLVACLFIPLGIAMIVAADSVAAIDIRYDEINRYTINHPGRNVFTFTAGNATSTQGIKTYAKFTLSKTLKAPVYLYYRLDNFYQNHRDYRNSRSLAQMAGKGKKKGGLVNCLPFRSPGETSAADEGTKIIINGQNTSYGNMLYVPCGLAPWSKFNDSFSIYRAGDVGSLDLVEDLASNVKNLNSSQLVCNTSDFDVYGDSISGFPASCSKKDIALQIDRDTQYRRQKPKDKFWTAQSNVTTDNPYLAQNFYHGEPGHKLPDVLDEDLMVWLRVAPLPNFKKLFRYFEGDLAAGDYIVEVTELWDVVGFKGAKYMTIETRSWIGGKNYVLGGAYIAFGSAAVVLFLGFGLRAFLRPAHWRKTRPAEDVALEGSRMRQRRS